MNIMYIRVKYFNDGEMILLGLREDSGYSKLRAEADGVQMALVQQWYEMGC